MPDKFRIALAMTVLALATVSNVAPASAHWFSWRAVPLYLVPL
jgi:hypothetical protein